jgi:alanine dehydrogenase
MNIGLVREKKEKERRVALNPRGVGRLIRLGHRIFFEKGIGLESRFSDQEYIDMGAEIVYRQNELFGRSDIILKVSPPTKEECLQMRKNQILMSFIHMAVTPPEIFKTLLEKRITAIGYEIMEADDESLPVLISISELAGKMAIHQAAHYLENESGGRGILLGSAPGLSPAVVVILGAGVAGTNAAQTASNLGAQVILLDTSLERLRKVRKELGCSIMTGIAHSQNIERFVKIADVLIGAVHVPGIKAPYLVPKELVESMKPGSAIVDLSIDQGGCIETSRPTTISNPTFKYKDIVHYCVPNLTSNIPRTASHALTIVTLPYVQEIANKGIKEALQANSTLRRGVYTYEGKCTKEVIAHLFKVECFDIESCLN